MGEDNLVEWKKGEQFKKERERRMGMRWKGRAKKGGGRGGKEDRKTSRMK